MTLCDSDLFFHQINPCDQFCHGVFDLQTGVHLEEEELARCVDQKFNGAGPHVIAGLGHFNRALSHFVSQCIVEQGRGRLFHDLLVTALDAALAFKQMHGVAMGVAQHLNFNVPRLLD